MRRRKYGSGPEPRKAEKPAWPLSPKDTKDLARLVSNYGRSIIAAAAKEVPVRGRGRPKRGPGAYFERVFLAQTVEEWAEEHRKAGSRKPLTEALIDLHYIMYGEDDKKHPVGNFLKTIKRKLIPARRELEEVREATRQREQWLRLQGRGCKGRK